jgi:hypothetical protein
MNRNYNHMLILVMSFLILSLPIAFGQDSGSTGNNAIGDAYQLNFDQPAQNFISTIGEFDYYKFYINNSGIARIKVSEVTEDMLTEICLYNKNGENAAPCKVASNAGDSTTLVKDIIGPGWYYIRIRDLAGKVYSTPYSVFVGFDSAPDQNEPNNGFGDATDIELGNTINAYICPLEDTDYYKINIDGPSVLVLKVQDVPEGMIPSISLWDINGQGIGGLAASNPGDSVTLEKGVSDYGIYYFRVMDNAGKAYSEPYAVTANLKES